MKSVSVITILLILVGAGLGVKLYLERSGQSEDFPIHRTITSSDGRELDVVIHGRSDESLSIERLSDGQRFALPLTNLGPEDREFADGLPITKTKSANQASQPGNPAGKESDPYIRSRLETIAKLEEKRLAMISEIESESLTSLIEKNRKNELERLETDLKSLRAAITQYKYRNGIN